MDCNGVEFFAENKIFLLLATKEMYLNLTFDYAQFRPNRHNLMYRSQNHVIALACVSKRASSLCFCDVRIKSLSIVIFLLGQCLIHTWIFF